MYYIILYFIYNYHHVGLTSLIMFSIVNKYYIYIHTYILNKYCKVILYGKSEWTFTKLLIFVKFNYVLSLLKLCNYMLLDSMMNLGHVLLLYIFCCHKNLNN